ncbi:MAG: hypothetical protein ACHQFX_20270 [Chitinophagales bacterium]
MKKINLSMSVILCALLFTNGICSKSDQIDNSGTGAVVLDKSEGFLITKTGISNGGNLGDSVMVRVYTSSYTIAGIINQAKGESIDHYWYIQPTGDGAWYVRSRKHGHYLGFRDDGGSAAGYHSWARYWVTLDATPASRNKFVPNKNGNKFFLQWLDDKTLYINTTTSPQISGPQQRATSIFLLTKKQEFFFLTK